MGVYAPRPPFTGEPENQYDNFFGGTSASAPMVTGVAGLIKAIKPELTPAQMKQILIETGDPISTDKPIGPRLNAYKAVCHPLVLNCAPPPTAPIWPMLQRNAQHTGLADVSGPPFAASSEVKVKWQKTLGFTRSFSPLIAANGTVYVPGRKPTETSSTLYALNGETGETVWQTPVPGQAYVGAIGPDGTIYICSNSSVQGTLSAFDSINGQKKWSFVVGGPRPCMDPVVDKQGVIYTAVPPAWNAQTAIAIAINPDGTEKWRYEETNTAASSPALSNDESQVYVALNNYLIAFSTADGHVLWTQNGNFGMAMAPVIDSQDRILITSDGYAGFVKAFSKSGTALWTSQDIGSIIGPPAINPQGQITIISSLLRNLYILDPQTGSSLSIIPLSVIPQNSFSAVDKNGLVYGNFSNNLDFTSGPGIAAIDANGIKWLFPTTPEGVWSTPALGRNNVLYFTTDNIIFALGE